VADDQHDDGAPPQGSMRFQDGTTTPREPTLAERKAREQAERRQADAERQAADDAERSRKKRKRILIGAGATVGVVAMPSRSPTTR
jgi:isoaspartyl peptidase/L-asparaginase-like protein (Ntn-hydrolase superfamily)